MATVIDTLKERGFIEQTTGEELEKSLDKPLNVYCGFDPTSDSLHLGNLVAIMGLAWFQRFGHTPFAIIGGATGMIGDPSGKSAERELLNAETIEKNLKGIRKNLEAVLDFEHPTTSAMILNNYDWFEKFSFLDFLRDVGKSFRMGPMLGKDSVRSRMDSDEGMSFTEFSYQLLQGYDFLHLFDTYNVTLQIGGSDQWGNITAGIDLIRKTRSELVHGLTMPLLTTSDGKKFGKSEKGAIWLSPEKLSPFEFYQYLYRTADADVIKLMRLLTFMEMEEIRECEKEIQKTPNAAQERLAEEVTRIVHGEEGVEIAKRVTKSLKPGSETVLDAKVLEEIAKDMPSVTLKQEEVFDEKLVELLSKTGLQKSKGDARRLIRNGGVYLNNTKVVDENYFLTSEDVVEGRMILLAAGKKNKMLIRIGN